MKTATISAFLAVLVAIPILFKKRESNLVEVHSNEGKSNEEIRRYDIDDFLTQ